MIRYDHMSIFDAPPGSLLVHACNCKGVWGAGVALQFKQRFPNAYARYQAACLKDGGNLLGTSLVVPDKGYLIGCLFTSIGYGDRRDPVDMIIGSTDFAIGCLFYHSYGTALSIYSVRLNAGLFCVPWEKTEKVIQTALDEDEYVHSGTTWTVCTPFVT